MGYDPFARGAFSVGVRSGELVDARRDGRRLPYEVWYPALGIAKGADVFAAPPSGEPVTQDASRDAPARAGRFPLVLYSHASGGHRRQATFLCTHLASHGYVVGAVDHIGNTAADLVERTRLRESGRVPTEAEAAAYLERIIGDRVPDLRFLCGELLAGDASSLIDRERIGLVGWSFGGWAVLATLEHDDRFGAVVACAPAGTSKPLPGIIPATLTYDWRRAVPTLLLAAERDRFVTLDGLREVFARTRAPKRMYVLGGADHQHFADNVDPEGACPRDRAHTFTRGLTLAHLDAALRHDASAETLLDDGAISRMAAMGVLATRE